MTKNFPFIDMVYQITLLNAKSPTIILASTPGQHHQGAGEERPDPGCQGTPGEEAAAGAFPLRPV